MTIADAAVGTPAYMAPEQIEGGALTAAIDQYDRWIKAMVDLTPDAQRMGAGFKPMWIGLHWPSLPWGEEGSGSFAAAGGKPLGQLFEATARDFGGSEAVRGPLKVIFDVHAQDPGASEVPARALASSALPPRTKAMIMITAS